MYLRLNEFPIIGSLIKKINFSLFKRKYRKLNRHNKTVPTGVFPLEIVKVGKYSYGEINVISYFPKNEMLKIGNCVSIAANVRFILGGNHQMETIFTFPIKSYIRRRHSEEDSWSKGDVVVEDNVWIGFGATILSGVTIGEGAIIGAFSVVTKNVLPYSIVCGNPAKVIRMRFSQEIIDRIKNVSLADIPLCEWYKYESFLYKPILNMEDADFVVGNINKNES